MEIAEEKVNGGKRFSYWIYILTCLIVTGVPAYEMSKDSYTGERDIYNIILQLVLTFIFSTLAWIIGKRRHLNYIWICTLGVAGNILIKVLGGVFHVLAYGGYNEGDLDFLGFLIFAFIGTTLIFTAAILLISYPIQLLFNKIEKKLH